METYFLLLIIVLFSKENFAKNLNRQLFDNGENYDFVDLTHSFNMNGATQTILMRDYAWYDSDSDTCTNERYGTHLDVRFIFSSQGRFVDEIPLKHLVLPLIIADVSDKVNGNGEFILNKQHLDYMLNNYFDDVKQPCLIVFKFGWSGYYSSDSQRYYGSGNDSAHFPGLSKEVATWITTSYKNVIGVGVDLPSVDPSSVPSFPATQTLINANVYVLTNVKLDQYIPDALCTALVSPLKVIRAIGAPVRVVAICPKSRMDETETFLHRLLK